MPITSSITDVTWSRIHLTLRASVDGLDGALPDELTFTIVDGYRVYPIDTTPLGDGEYELRINVTNFYARSQVPDGTWRFVPVIGEVETVTAKEASAILEEEAAVDDESAAGEELAFDEDVETANPPARYDTRELARLDDWSRSFLYSGNRVGYVVAFGISEDDDCPEFLMRTYQLFRNPKSHAPKARPSLRRWVAKRMLSRAKRVRYANDWYRLSRRINPPRGNRILFASEMRSAIGGNLERVRDRMVERGLDSRFEMRYSFRTPQTYTNRSTLRVIYLLATSDIVLIDDYFGMLASLRLSPATKVIQLWHAGSGFKSIGYSRFGIYGSPKLQNAHRKYTYAITGSKHLVPVYAEAFGIEESAVIPTGLPRIDTFLDPDRSKATVDAFFAQYPHLRGKRLILFAPTFRGRGFTDAHYDYSRIDFDALYEMCGEDTAVLFRMHHFIDEAVPIPPQYSDRFFDFTAYPDGNDLLHVVDVLITDYSSIIYEFALLNKPMLFYAYDKEVYAATRGFHRSFEQTAPGRVCESFDELIKALQEEEYETSKIETFRRENFDAIDTHAADRVIDQLILGDPRTTEVAASESAQRDPTTGDTAFGDEELSDQEDA